MKKTGTKNFRLILLVSGFLSSLTVFPCGLPEDTIRIRDNQILIVNETGGDQVIQLGRYNFSLADYTIEKDARWKSPEFNCHPVIRIYTNDRFQEYMLTPGKKYRLYLDERKKCVDIKIIREKHPDPKPSEGDHK